MYLASPLKTLAQAIEPSRFIVECGGDGQCGPNTLSFLLGLAGLAELDGPQLRFAVAAHASKPEVQNRVSSVTTQNGRLSMRELIVLNVSHWPPTALGDLPPTVESWCSLIVARHVWTDVAFTHLVADLYSCAIHMLGVDCLSEVWDMGTLSPCDGRAATALLEVAVWVGRHLAGVVDTAPEGGAAPPALPSAPPPESGLPLTARQAADALLDECGPAMPPPVSHAELLECLDALDDGADPDDYEVLLSHTLSRGLASDVTDALRQRLDDWVDCNPIRYLSYAEAHGAGVHSPQASAFTVGLAQRLQEPDYDSEGETLPYTTISQVRVWAARHEGNIALAGFEFTASSRSDLDAMGYSAISADKRLCNVGGHHFCGDARPLLSAFVWERALLFPPCHQHLRGDIDCIEAKIKDGRAFWGAALVLFCVVATTAKIVMVEQPDTLFNDAFDPGAYPDVKVFEFRTSEYGDQDKFVRLTTRNVGALPPPPHPGARPPQLPRSQFDHRNPDQRDRARSSWQPYTNTRAALSSVVPALPGVPPPVDYVAAVCVFAAAWAALGFPVPRGFMNPLALPPLAARAYQRRRGPGDGRAAGGASLLTSSFSSAYVGDSRLIELPEPPALACDAWCSDEALATGHSSAAQQGIIAGAESKAGVGSDDWRFILTTPLLAPPASTGGSVTAVSNLAARRWLEQLHPTHLRWLQSACALSSEARPVGNGAGPPLTSVSPHDLALEIARDRLAMSEGIEESHAGAALRRALLGRGPAHAGHGGASTASVESETDVETDDESPPPAPQLVLHQVDLRTTLTEGAAAVLFICVIGQPLVWAHMNGFSTIGLEVPPAARSTLMSRVRALVATIVTAFHVVFMIGRYASGLSLYSAPVDFVPEPTAICRTPAQRRRWLRGGASFAWCTLAALYGTQLHDPATRAFATADMFQRPVPVLADDPSLGRTSFKFGGATLTSVAPRPSPDAGGAAWTAIQAMLAADELLVGGLLSAVSGGDPLLSGWAEQVTPLDPNLVPRDLLENVPSFDDARLDAVRLSPIKRPLTLPWLSRPPQQRPAPVGTPTCPTVAHMLLPEAQRRMDEWLRAAHRDLSDLERQLKGGVAPAAVTRHHRPKPIAIGQGGLHRWARGRVWDCRGACCVVADWSAPHSTGFNLTYLESRLRYYPDQYLTANLLEGARLDADVELQSVFVPHLTSLPLGFESVEKELHRLHALGWYSFSRSIPFWPMYCNGQGAASRKLEIWRWRRTTDAGAPRIETFDETGLRVLSINEASHINHTPVHFAADDRPEFVAWLASRGLPSDDPPPNSGGVRFSKWPKEVKPLLEHAMRDDAVLRRSGEVTSQPIYGMGDDAKDYFSQLGIAASDLHKLGIVFLSRPGDFEGASREAGLTFVSEKRLGFGTHGASNLAQRFSDSLLDLYREDMDEAEERMRAAPTPAELPWLETRLALQRRTGEPCVAIRRWGVPPEGVLTDIAAPSQVADIPLGYVCPQLRMYSIRMFTDDIQATFVGVERTLEGLRTWRRLTTDVGLLMAIPEKRSLGSWIKFLGVVLIPALGLVVVPRDKILRATAAVNEALRGGMPFHAYRSLCGLLEHLRAVNLRGRNVMHGLYRPHGPTGASRHGPSGLVFCDELMSKQLLRWRHLLFNTCGTSVKQALFRSELEPAPHLYFDVTSDACLADGDALAPGIGGFCHGLFWHFVVPEADREYLTIPVLELLGVCLNVLTFFSYLILACQSGEARAAVVLRTDALSSARALPAESTRGALMTETFQALRETQEWSALATFILVTHLYGDCNPFTDLLSRQRLAEFQRLCAQLGIRPKEVPLSPAARRLYEQVVSAARRLHAEGGERAAKRQRAGAQSVSLLAPFGASTLTPSMAARMGIAVAESAPAPVPTIAAPASSTLTSAMARRLGLRAPPSESPLAEAASQPSRRVAGLMMPPAPPPKPPTPLRLASQQFARRRMVGFTQGDDPSMAFNLDESSLAALGEAVEEAVDGGVNYNTNRFDERAWEFWEHVCSTHNTSPLRTETEARDHPARNAHLLACLALHAFSVCKPKSKDRHFVKPASALAYAIAIIRIFKRWGIAMPGFSMVKAACDGLSRMYLALHGPYSLGPRRAEAMTFVMVGAMHAIPHMAQVGSRSWDHGDHDVFMFRCLSVFMMFTAFRLAEIVGNGSTEIFYLVWASLWWRINGIMIKKPTRAQLLSMRFGRDVAIIFPPRSKPDQMGTIHCPFPVTLTYEGTTLNACAMLREMELRVGPTVADRDTTPLFCNAAGGVYSHGFLNSLLRMVLAHLYGTAVSALYTWHSFRAGLATALHAAKVPDEMIQLICRWMCPESLHCYRRKGTREHENYINAASRQNVDAIQSANVVRVQGDEGYAAFLSDLNLNATDRHFTKQLEKPDEGPAAATVPNARAPPKSKRAKETPHPLLPLTGGVKVGDAVVIPRRLWPKDACSELGGAGWAATVVRTTATATAATVKFTHASTRGGRRYESVLVPVGHLARLA